MDQQQIMLQMCVGGKKEKFNSTHIAQNIAETCQEYFQYYIAIEILS